MWTTQTDTVRDVQNHAIQPPTLICIPGQWVVSTGVLIYRKNHEGSGLLRQSPPHGEVSSAVQPLLFSAYRQCVYIPESILIFSALQLYSILWFASLLVVGKSNIDVVTLFLTG